jgi:hypothetical protein
MEQCRSGALLCSTQRLMLSHGLSPLRHYYGYTDGNSLVTLKGLQRCDRLEDVRLSGNALTSLQGLRAAAATLDVSDPTYTCCRMRACRAGS